MTKSVAGIIYDAQLAYMVAEQTANDAIGRACGFKDDAWDEYPWDAITYDYYDNSFELKGVTVGWVPTDETIDQWKALRFARMWVCYTDGTEKYIHLCGDGFDALREGHDT